jgi:hypothetical protein
VKVETGIVVMIAVVMTEAVVVASEMKEEQSVGIVVRVRKETDREEGTVVHVRKETDHHVHKEIVHREIVRRVHRGTVVRVRKETDRKVSVDLVHRVYKVTGRRVRKESVSHVQNSHPHHRLRRILPLQPRHHQLHQRLIMVPLRASRGRKPCYWHRHVQNIAASIAVA